MKYLSKVTLAALSLLLFSGCGEVAKKPKYVFYFIGDGMGLSLIQGTEFYKGAHNNMKIVPDTVSFAYFPTVGIANTSSSNYYITDSAAAGTALASGHKTKQGTIGMDTTQVIPLKSIAIRAKEQGYGVGIVTSVSIDHATPAAFYAHNKSRKNYYEIAMDGATSGIDILAGSGFVEPQKDGHKSVFDAYKEAGYTHFAGKSSIGGIASCDSKVLVTERSGARQESFSYAVDRTPEDLSLSDLVSQSITYLFDRYKEKGFLLVAEGGMIDWASHDNDFASAVGEVLDFDDAIALAYEFYKMYPEETLIVVTSDHETGGYGNGVSKSGYNMYPTSIDKSTQSKEYYRRQIKAEIAKKTKFESLPIPSGVTFSEEETKQLKDIYKKNPSKYAPAAYNIINQQVGAGWTTNGHTAAPVMIFSVGASHQVMGGRMDNTEIPKRIASLLNI